LNIFFDNCTPTVLASSLDGHVKEFGHRAIHIKDLSGLAKGRHASDLEWIERLRSDERRWIFITSDMRLTKNRAEIEALQSAGLLGFVLAAGFQKMPFHHRAALLIWRWPDIENMTKLVEPPAMFEIPVNRSTGLKQLRF